MARSPAPLATRSNALRFSGPPCRHDWTAPTLTARQRVASACDTRCGQRRQLVYVGLGRAPRAPVTLPVPTPPAAVSPLPPFSPGPGAPSGRGLPVPRLGSSHIWYPSIPPHRCLGTGPHRPGARSPLGLPGRRGAAGRRAGRHREEGPTWGGSRPGGASRRLGRSCSWLRSPPAPSGTPGCPGKEAPPAGQEALPQEVPARAQAVATESGHEREVVFFAVERYVGHTRCVPREHALAEGAWSGHPSELHLKPALHLVYLRPTRACSSLYAQGGGAPRARRRGRAVLRDER